MGYDSQFNHNFIKIFMEYEIFDVFICVYHLVPSSTE